MLVTLLFLSSFTTLASRQSRALIRRADVIDAHLSDLGAQLDTNRIDSLNGGASNPDRR